MLNRYFFMLLACFGGISLHAHWVSGQNVGIGTASPAEKLHIAGTLRVDALSATTPSTNASRMLYADGVGKVYSLPTGATGLVLGINPAGEPAWLNPGTLVTAGDLTTSNPALAITGGTGAVLGTGTSIDVLTNALNQAGIVTGPTLANANQVWGTNNAGVPGWIPPAAIVKVQNGLNISTTPPNAGATSPMVELGGTLVRHTTITQDNFDYLSNLSGTGIFEVRSGAVKGNGLLVDPTNRVGVGAPVPSEKVHIGGLTNTIRVEGLGAGGSHLTAPAANTDRMLYTSTTGVIKAMPNGANGTVLTINGSGVPAWTGVTSNVSVDNGLYYNAGAGKIRQGGVLVENTTITGAGFNYTHDLTGIGDFVVTENSNLNPSLFVKGNDGATNDGYVGVFTTTPVQQLDVNGRMAVQNGVIQRGTTQITATSDLGLYSQPAGSWVRVASNAAPIKFFTDQGGANGAGTQAIMAVDNTNGGAVKIHAESSGLGNAGAASSKAALDVQSTSKGMHIPRMTTAQRDAIAPGASQNEGLIIYNTTTDCVEFWDTKPTTTPLNGFWNSMCKWCEDVYIYSSNSNGNNFYAQAGSPNRPKKWCVYVNAGVTLGASTTGGTALSFASLPAGSTVYLYNYGSIIGGGGNGGGGGQERDASCGGDTPGGTGGVGGDAIVSSATVSVSVTNFGIIGGGGGGGGGGAGGCRSNGGGGGGGAGIAAGGGGPGNNGGHRASGTICTSCSAAPASTAGNVAFTPTSTTGGSGGCSNGNAGGGCLYSGSNGGCGGNGGNIGANGANGTGTTCGTLLGGAQFGNGGGAGQAIRGNGGGSYITNSGGTIYGFSTP